jgi:hypothetical protein
MWTARHNRRFSSAPNPLGRTQEPFYRLLGSRNDQKRLPLYETDPNIPLNELIKETLNWLDQYLGPVN